MLSVSLVHPTHTHTRIHLFTPSPHNSQSLYRGFLGMEQEHGNGQLKYKTQNGQSHAIYELMLILMEECSTANYVEDLKRVWTFYFFKQVVLKGGFWTSSIYIIWELVTKANSWPPSWCVITETLSGSLEIWALIWSLADLLKVGKPLL